MNLLTSFFQESGELSFSNSMTSSGEGGIPLRSQLNLRISVCLGALGFNPTPFPFIESRTKTSIASDPLAEICAFLGALYAQCSLEKRHKEVTQKKPPATKYLRIILIASPY